MQKKFLLVATAAFLISLSGCQRRKTQKMAAKPKADHASAVNMPMAANNQSKVHFFDEDLGEFETLENLETIVLDESLDAMSPMTQKVTFQDAAQEKEMLTVYFDYDSTKIREDQKQEIALAKRQIEEWVKEGKKVVFKGHACEWHGTHDYNLGLSKKRAGSLAEVCLIDPSYADKVTVFGVGNEEPIAFEQSFEGQTPNRRVEIYAV